MKKSSIKMFALIVTLFTFGLFYSCSDESIMPDAQEELASVSTDNIYQMPINQAITELQNFLGSFEDSSDSEIRTRTADRITSLRKIDMNSIITIKRNQVDTRALSSDNKVANLLYVVNFDNNNGYAVLSADTRIPAVVLAMVNDGRASIEDFSMDEGSVVTEDMVKEEIEDFSFYNAEEDDIYVGGTMENKNSHLYLCQYAVDRIEDFEVRVDGRRDPSPKTTTHTRDWIVKESVSPLLETKWNQRSPFNDQCPSRRRYIFFGPSRKAPTGCVPTAIAQIVAYHEYPKIYYYNGQRVDWKKIKTIYNFREYYDPGTDTEAKTMAAAFLRSIGNSCNVLYAYSFSFGLPSKAKKYLKSIGYSNVSNPNGKNESRIIEMLRKANPVFMSATNRGIKGHAWVIDGMKIRERTIDTVNAKGIVISSKKETDTYYHCNWGWNGASDGYYYANAFNTKKDPVERDAIDTNKRKGPRINFKWFFSIITYDNPLSR